MDEKQLQLLWESHAKNGGFKDYNEFKSLMNDGNARKIYFDDANSQLGFKDYTEFETILQVTPQKKNQVGSVSTNGSPISVSPYGVTQGGLSVDEVSRKPEEDINTNGRSRERWRKEETEKYQAGQQPLTTNLQYQATDARLGSGSEGTKEKIASPQALGKALAMGAASGVSGTLKGIGIAAKELDWFNEYEGKDAKELATYKAGQWVDETVRDLVGDLSPEEQRNFSVKLFGGVGQAASMMGGGWLAKAAGASVPLTMASMGAAQQGSSEWENAVAAGATPEQASKVFWINSVLGTTDAWPMVGAFRKLDKYTGGVATGALAQRLSSTIGGRITNEIMQGFVKEAAQEAGQQFLTNLTAQQTYDATRSLFQDVLESGAIGGIIGGTLTGVLGGVREKMADPNITPEEYAELKKTEDFVVQTIEETNKIEAENQGKKSEPSVATEAKSEIPKADQQINQPTNEQQEADIQTPKKEKAQPQEITEAVEAAKTDIKDEVYRNAFTENPDQSLKEIAQQLNSSKSEADATRRMFGDRISDIALKLYPQEKVAPQDVSGKSGEETHEQVMERAKTGEPITVSAYRIEKSGDVNEKTGVFFGDKGITEEYKRRNDTDFYNEGGKPEDRRFGGEVKQYDISFKNPLVVRSKEEFIKQLAENGDKEAQAVMPNYKESDPAKLETTHKTHEAFDEFVAKKAREKGHDGIITPLEYVSLDKNNFKQQAPKEQLPAGKIKSSWESNIEALIHPETGLAATIGKMDTGETEKAAFLKRKGMTFDDYKKLDDTSKQKIQNEWVKSKEFEELQNKKQQAPKEQLPASTETKSEDVRQRYLDDFNVVEDSKFDWRVKSELSSVDRKKAVADIKAGKETAATKKLNKEMDEAIERGTVIINRGRGTQAETVEIPIDDWFGFTQKEQDQLVKSMDKLDENSISIINENNITLDNIDSLKHLFDGFPYDQTDFQAIKDYLSKSSSSDKTRQVSEASKEKVTEETEVGKPPTAEKKSAADKIRGLKIKPQGLQSNIAGLPIALWNGVVETVATAVEGGMTLTQAIKKAIADHNLKDEKDFDQKELISKLEEATGEKFEEEGKLSGIKKALVSDDVVKGVDMERVSDEDMMAMGRKILETGEVKPRELVQKIITEKQGVLTPAEVVGLIYYKADLDNKLRETYTDINKKKEAGEDLGTLAVEAQNIEREISDYEVMSVITAQQQSLAFRLRQKLLDQDYNVVTQIEKYKANNDGYIPPEVEEKFKELDKKIKDVKNRLWDVQQMRELKEAQDAVQNIKEEVERELKRGSVQNVEKKVKEGVAKEIDAIYQKLPKDKKSAADKAIQALENIQKKLRGKAYSDASGFVAFLDAGITTIKNAIKAGVAIADAIELGIAKIKELAGKSGVTFNEDEVRKDFIEGFKEEGVSTDKDQITLNDDGSLNIPEKLLKEKVASGITDIEKLTDEVHKEAVKVKPDATKREVRDAITDYGKKINPTSDTVKIQLNTAKRIGRLLSELEDLQNKKTKEKKPSTAAKLTTKERELKRQIRALQQQAGIDNKRHLTDEEKLSAAKERVRNKIAELEQRIKDGDFAKKEKLPPPKDDELVKLEAEKEKLQEQFENEQYKLKLKNRNFWQKAEDVVLELFSGLVRGLVASVDLSAGLVQGMYRLFTNPKRSMQAFGTMFHHLVSQKASDEYLSKIKASKAYPLMQASKLAIDDKSGHVSAKEGLFISNWINFLWNNVVSKVLGVGHKGATEFIKKLNPYAASQRAFDGYVNSIRVNTFSDMAKSLTDAGYNFEANPEVFKKAADFVNTTTGRGSLGAADPNSKWLNIFLFAPRKVVSEIKLFTPYAFAYYAKMPKPVRTRALKNLSVFLTSFVTTNALLWMSLKPDDDDEEKMRIWEDFWNPNSSNFLTHQIGSKRVSIGGGAKSMITFLSRLVTGKYVDQYGQETKLGDRYGKQINTRFDLLTNFIAGKTSPAINVGIQKMQERKNLEVDNTEIAKNLTVPIWLQDIKDLYKDDPASVNGIVTALSIFGANVRVPDEKSTPFTDQDKKDPTFKYFLDKGMSLPNVMPASVDVPDKATKTMKNLTDYPPEKIKEYQDLHKENLKKELKEVKDKGYVYEDDYGNISSSRQKGYDRISLNELSKEQLAKVLKAAQAQATVKTKEKLFPK